MEENPPVLSWRALGAGGLDVVDAVKHRLRRWCGEQRSEAVIFQIELLIGGAKLVDGAGQFIDPGQALAQQDFESANRALFIFEFSLQAAE